MSKHKTIDWFWIDEDLKVKALLRADSPYWLAQFNLPGVGQRRRSLKTKSKKQARLNGYKLVRELANNTLENPRPRRWTVAAVATQRRQRLAEHGRSPRSIAVVERADRLLMAHLPKGGKTAVTQLSTQVLEEFERRLRTSGVALPPREGSKRGPHKPRPLAPKTVRDIMKWVRGLIRYARQHGMLASDPAPGYELPPGPSPEIETFSPAELAALYADPDPAMAEIWQFLTETCLRAGEFIWLLADDVIVDDQGQPIAVHVRAKSCPQTGRRWKPKHGIKRIVPLTTGAAAIVQRRLASSTVPWLFEVADTQSDQPGKWSYPRLRRRLAQRLKAAGMEHGHLHVFRHTGATHLANDAAMPIAQLQKFLGHKYVTTTQTYLHPRPEDMAATLARIDFGKLTDTTLTNTDGSSGDGGTASAGTDANAAPMKGSLS